MPCIKQSLTRLTPFLLCLLLATAASARELASIQFEEKISLGGNELVLNGVGLRKRLVFKVYAMGLYLPQKVNTPAAILANKGAKRIQIVTLRELEAEQLVDALVEGLRKNLNASEQEKLASRIESFRNTMLSIGKSPEKTVVLLDYLPANGTSLSVNGETRGTAIPGEDFYNALLRIWLGSNPAQEDLREQLSGRND